MDSVKHARTTTKVLFGAVAVYAVMMAGALMYVAMDQFGYQPGLIVGVLGVYAVLVVAWAALERRASRQANSVAAVQQ